VFEKLRLCRRPALLYGMPPESSDAWFRELTEPVLRDAGLPFMAQHVARCCVREWGRYYRTRRGPELAEHLQWSLDKYRDQGVSQEILEQLLAVLDEAVGPHSEVGHALD
jgi:hypothetical protein